MNGKGYEMIKHTCFDNDFHPLAHVEDNEKIRKKDRKEYHRKRYLEHKDEIKKRYNSQTQYIKWIEAKKTITRLKKQIGTNNYELLMDEFEKLNRVKYS